MDQVKERIGEAAASLVEDGMLVGLGTGSTASCFIRALARRVSDEGISVATVATSLPSEKLARELNLACVSIDAISSIDLTFDGADEIDAQKCMIKGAGGALLKEKIVAYHSRELVVLVDVSKCVEQLGAVKLPVEVVQFGQQLTQEKLLSYATSAVLRLKGDGRPFITESNHFIYDLELKEKVTNPEALDLSIRSIPGVVVTGLFYNLAGRVLIGSVDGTVKMLS
jgi:ribose 5-phosphate isomerase A